MYMHLYNQISTLTYTHIFSEDASQKPLSSASVQRWALQPWGEAPASSTARAGQAEHLAPWKGHPHPHPSTPTALRRVKEASPTIPIPSLYQALPCVTHMRSLTTHILWAANSVHL